MNMPTPQQTSETGAKVRSVSDYENDPNYIVVQIEDDDGSAVTAGTLGR